MKTIEITVESYEFLKNLAHEIETQDNRGTDRPIWVIRTNQKISCLDKGVSEKTEFASMESGEWETYPTRNEAITHLVRHCDLTVEEAEKDSNRHRYEEHGDEGPRPYAQNAFRNPEYDGLIKAIKEIGRI